MKKALFLTAALLNCMVAQAEMTLNLELTSQTGDAVKTMESTCVLNNDEAMTISSQDFEIAIVAQAVDNDVEISCAVACKNEDGSCKLISKPIIKTTLNEEARLTIGSNDEDEETLTLVCTVQQTGPEAEAEEVQ